jgi:hypothetical protein
MKEEENFNITGGFLMPRHKTKDKIKRYIDKQAEILKYNSSTIKLLYRLADDCQNGLIEDFFSTRSTEYINSIFLGSNEAFLASLLELQVSKLVNYDRSSDMLYFYLYSSSHFNNLICKLRNRKRKYLRDPEAEKGSILSILNSGKVDPVIQKAMMMANMNIKGITISERIPGVLVPETLFPYFTGEPLPESEVNSLLKYEQHNLLSLEQSRRNLNPEDKRVFFACLALCDKSGIIEDYNRYSLLKEVLKEFGNESFSQGTWYGSLKKLIDLKLLIPYKDEGTGFDCLKIGTYKESFSSNSRYVILPTIVLNKAFKALEASAVKLFFYFMFMLNNGEEITDNGKPTLIGQEKFVWFKYTRLSTDSQEKKDNFQIQNLWLKKRYTGEYEKILLGEVDGEDFNALSDFFHFNFIGPAVQVRIRREFYITKKSDKVKQLLALQGRYKRKTMLIEDFFKEHNIEYGMNDLIDCIRIFKKETKSVILKILALVAERINLTAEKGLDEIRSLGGYTRYRYKLYRKENPELIPE